MKHCGKVVGFVTNPYLEHYKAAKRVLRYVTGTAGKGLEGWRALEGMLLSGGSSLYASGGIEEYGGGVRGDQPYNSKGPISEDAWEGDGS